MKRAALIIFAIIVLVMISCVLAQRKPQHENDHIEIVDVVPPRPLQMNGEDQSREPSQPKRRTDTRDGPSAATIGPVTQFDSKALDQNVIDMAHRFHVEPSTYRLLVREGSDGTKVYRMLGMHVIVSPTGEEVFLPDEL